MQIYIVVKNNEIVCAFTKPTDALYFKNKDKNYQMVITELDKDEFCKSYQDSMDFLNNAKDSMGFYVI